MELARDAERAEQGGAAADSAWLDTIFPETDVPTVGATDYVRALPRMIASWINGPRLPLWAPTAFARVSGARLSEPTSR